MQKNAKKNFANAKKDKKHPYFSQKFTVFLPFYHVLSQLFAQVKRRFYFKNVKFFMPTSSAYLVTFINFTLNDFAVLSQS